MVAATPDRTLAKYYLYQVTLSHGFVTPVAVEYMLSRDVSLAGVGTASAVFMAAWVAGEVPTGYASDRIGRRRALMVASATSATAIALLGVGRSLPAFVVAHALWAVGVTFRSGAGDAWLYEVLDDRLDADTFTRVKGRGWAVRLVVTASAAVAGSHLAAVRWTYPFAANAALVASGVVVLATFPAAGRFAAGGGAGADTDGDSNADTDGDSDPPSLGDCLRVATGTFARPPLRSFVVYVALFFGLVEAVLTYVQPIATGVGLAVADLGWLYAGLALVGAAAGYLADDLRTAFGVRRVLLVAPAVLAVVLVVAAAVPVLVVPAFFAVRFVRSATTTLRSQYLNDRVGSVARATLLSTASMVFAATAAVTRQVGGLVADVATPLTMVGLFALAFLGATAALGVVGSPVPADGAAAAGSAAD